MVQTCMGLGFRADVPIRDNIPTRRFPVVTVTLIAINAAVWILYQLPDLDKAVVESGWIPCEVNGTCDPPGPSWPIDAVTSMFMHGSWIHIIGNMLFLWIFGNNIEDRIGRVRFIVFYFAAGFAATALQTFITLRFGTPKTRSSRTSAPAARSPACSARTSSSTRTRGFCRS